MAFLRRSMNNRDSHTHHISQPITSISRPTPSTQPPTKVIRALEDYRSRAPQELSFQKGDFFHVIRDISQDSGWYEANNPMTGARGLVPKSKFEEFNKSNAALRLSQAAVRLPPKSPGARPAPTSPRQPVFYAVVQHEFVAERADELDANAGDHISVVAQSNFEWFVAKPISRLGRPGLIPVSFVAIHDPNTGRAMSEEEVRDLMRGGDIPGVEDWKKSILDYKAASISLGVIDDEGRSSVPNSPFAPLAPYQQGAQDPPSPRTPLSQLPPGLVVSAEVSSWHLEMNEYWFRVNALYQPDDIYNTGSLPPAKQLTLYRVYDDFYQLQVGLKRTFPVEAGDQPARPGEAPKRVLPFMPSPVARVDEAVTVVRKDELHGYLVELCSLWEFGAEHMLRHQFTRHFFTPKSGDSEEDVEPATWALDSRKVKKYTPVQEEEEEEIQKPFAGLNVQDGVGNRFSEGSHYEEENGYGRKSFDRQNVTSPPPAQQYNGAGPAYPRSQSPYTSSSTTRTQSPLPANRASGSSSRNYSAEAAMARSTSAHSHYSRNDREQVISYISQRRPSDDSPRSFSSNPSLPPPTGGTITGRARSASNANNPPISATNPNPAFIKIKIFHKSTQDLIAIRVNPRVTHAQLMDKVRDRLGDDVQQLEYRKSLENKFVTVEDDWSLKRWLDEEPDKHVLYAD